MGFLEQVKVTQLIGLLHVPEKVWDPKFCGGVCLGQGGGPSLGT